jgi:hypothetical protein
MTQLPVQLEDARRLPQGFFNDARDGVNVRHQYSIGQSLLVTSKPSTMPSTHSRSSARRRRAPAHSPTSRPYSFLGRFSSFVHRSQPNTDEPTELQQGPMPSIPLHDGPRVVEVAAIRDKEVCLAVVFFQPLKSSDSVDIVCCSEARAH